MTESLEVRAIDGFDQLGPLQVSALTATEIDQGAGAFTATVHIGGRRSVAAQLYDASFPGIEIYNPDTGWRFAGEVSETEWVRSAAGDEITFTGRDFQSFLNDYRLYPNAGDVTSAWDDRTYNTARASTMALAEVRINAGSGALADRQIAGLTLGTDPVAGPILDYTIKNQVMLEAFQTWFADSDYTFRLGLIRPSIVTNQANLHFEVFQRPTAEILVSPQAGNMEAFRVRRQAGRPSHYIGIGSIIPTATAQRFVIEAGGPQDSWLTRRKETIYSRPSADFDELFSEAQQTQLANAATRTVQIDGAELKGYGKSVDLGWLVPVQIGIGAEGEKLYLPVKSSTVQMTSSGAFVRTVDIGGISENTSQRIYNAIGAASQRLTRIEQEL